MLIYTYTSHEPLCEWIIIKYGNDMGQINLMLYKAGLMPYVWVFEVILIGFVWCVTFLLCIQTHTYMPHICVCLPWGFATKNIS